MTTHKDPAFDQAIEHLREAYRLLGFLSGRDPETARTPERVAGLLKSVFAGLDPACTPPLSVTEYEGGNMVLIRDLPYYSMCAHHLLPFFGKACIAYIPAGKVVGLGSFPQILDYFSRRPQLQERLAEQIADHLEAALKPEGLIVYLTARQMCMEMRGIARPGVVEYAATRGSLTEGALRREFFIRVGAQEPTGKGT